VLADGYLLVPAAPPPADAVRLRAESGLTRKTLEQCERAMAGSWAAAHVVHLATGEVVGMGRVIGDGGWYFHVVDMATLPAHQRQGIGRAVLEHLLARIRAEAPPGAYTTLLADGPGRPLYRSLGFVETGPRTIGMWLPGG